MRVDWENLEGGQTVDRDKLSAKTRSNLDRLEANGFAFDPFALAADTSGKGRKTIVVAGRDSYGDKVLFVRRETENRKAGRTFLSTPSGSIQVSSLLDKRTGSQTTEKALAKYK